MGIAGLYQYIKSKVLKEHPECIKPCTLKELAQWMESYRCQEALTNHHCRDRKPRLLIDGNSFMYKFTYGNKPYSHILQFGWFMHDLLLLNIEPVVIFDGKHPEEKKEENERRAKEKQKFMTRISESQQQIKELKVECGFDPEKSIDDVDPNLIGENKKSDYETIQKLEDNLEKDYTSRSIVTPQQIEEVKEFLRCIGIWVIQAPDEGEAYCALMNNLGFGECVATDDSDIFPFGGKYIIRDIGCRGNRDMKSSFYDIKKILNIMGVTGDELIDICTLCRNDYNKTCRVENLGFVNALKGIRQHGSIEAFFESKVQKSELDKVIFLSITNFFFLKIKRRRIRLLESERLPAMIQMVKNPRRKGRRLNHSRFRVNLITKG